MTTKVMEGLKPCPFCGATDEEFQLQPYQMHNLGGEPTDWAVECANCAAFGPTALTSEASATAWNTRASHADPLRRALEKARSQFELYVQAHMSKSPPDMDKAATNQEFVEMIDAALSSGENNNGE